MLTEHAPGWGSVNGHGTRIKGTLRIHFFPKNDILSLCTHFTLDERLVSKTKFVAMEDLHRSNYVCGNCKKNIATYEKFGCRSNEITAMATPVKTGQSEKISKLRFRKNNPVDAIPLEKVLVEAGCTAPGCNEKGVAYEDPNAWKHKPHYCINHNPLIKGAVAA